MKWGNLQFEELKKSNPVLVLFFILISICISFLVYIDKLQFPLHGKHNFLVAAAIAILLSAIFIYFYNLVIKSFLSRLHKNQIIIIIFISLFLALLASSKISFDTKHFYFLSPEQKITINADISEKNHDGFSIIQIKNGFRDISYSELEVTGKYDILPDGIHFFSGQNVNINWKGIAGQKISFEFYSAQSDQIINFQWDNESIETIFLKGGSDKIIISHKYLPPINEELFIRVISFPIIFALLFLTISGFYGPFPYSSVIIIFWIFILLIFWPGIIGNVNLTEINKLFAGNIDDWHPVVYTIIIGVFTRLFSTPTSYLIFQIISLGLIIGWGFSFLESQGANKKVLWILTFLISILPSNFLSIISLTNDITYSIALLALTILILKIVFSEGIWLEKPKNLIAFAFISIVSLSTRYNGIPAVGFSLLCLVLFFPKHRKYLIRIIALIIFALLILNGPIFHLIGVQRVAEGQFDNILLHHISAHVNSGTYLENDQKEYLDSLYPLEDWAYSCCSNTAMITKQGFDDKAFHANSSLNKKIALDLLVKSPIVDLKHILCASDIVWNIAGNCDISHPLINQTKGKYIWTRSDSSEYGENSKLPSLVAPLFRLLLAIDESNMFYILVWRPAIYLYLSILSVLIFFFRNKIKGSLIILCPIIGQSLFLFAFNRIQNFRYQYCAVLIGLFLTSLIFFSRKQN